MAAATLLLASLAAPAQMSLRQALLLRHAGSTIAPPAEALPAPSQTTEDALRALAVQADMIFAGEVVAIRHEDAGVSIDWRILHGIRQAQTGQIFTQREWAGLWSGDDARYRVGQRSLVLLHAASAAGFRTPVGGQDGVLPLNGDTFIGAADLRWIAQRQQRSVGAGRSSGLQVVRTAAVVAPSSAAASVIAASDVAAPDLQHMDAAIVTDLLTAWTGGEHQ